MCVCVGGGGGGREACGGGGEVEGGGEKILKHNVLFNYPDYIQHYDRNKPAGQKSCIHSSFTDSQMLCMVVRAAFPIQATIGKQQTEKTDTMSQKIDVLM